MKEKKRKKQKVYIRLISTYLIVFSIPLIMNITSLEKTSESVKKEISRSVLKNLNHTRDMLYNNFREIDNIVEKLSLSSEIRYVAQMQEQEKYIEVSKLKSAQELMGAMQIQTFVEEYYLFLDESNMVISPDHIFLDENSMKPYFQYGNNTWDEWMEKIKGEKYLKCFFQEKNTIQNGKARDMLLYVQSLVTISGVKGNFVFPIRSDAIETLLEDDYVANAGWAYLLDENGEAVLTIPSAENECPLVQEKYLKDGRSIQETRINGEDVLVLCSKTSDKEFTLVAVLPQEYISRQIYTEQKRTIMIMAGVLVAGAICILLLSYSRGRRINQIMEMLFKVDERGKGEIKGDEMNYISASLNRLIHKNMDLKESIREKETINKGLLLENLLYGKENRMDNTLEQYGIFLKGKNLLVIAFQIRSNFSGGGQSELPGGAVPVYKQILQNGMSVLFPEGCYMCDLSLEDGAFIGVLDREAFSVTEKELEKSLKNLSVSMSRDCGVHVRLAVSNICDDVALISRCYDQVYEMIQYEPIAGKDILFYRDNMRGKEYYYFPLPLEERIVNAVRTGNGESLHAHLREVYQINVLERSISPEMMHFLVNDLQCTVFRVLHLVSGQVSIQEEVFRELEELNRETDILVRFNKINRIFQFICECVEKENRANDSEQAEKILKYIESEYAEGDLSLTKISEHFGYASTYFSKLFKELFHENFAAYLEKVRIENVCELLEQTEDTMEKIAKKTGYNSVYVMRSAFKRVKGVTPNEWRKIKSGKANGGNDGEKNEN